MARLWTCGFELQSANNSTVGEFNVGSGTPSISTTTVRSGAASLRFNSAAYSATLITASTPSHVFLRAYIYVAARPASGSNQILSFRRATGTFNATLNLNASGQLTAGIAGATTSPSTAIPLSTWTRIELDYNETTTSISGYINGSAFVTGVTIAGSLTNTGAMVQFGNASGASGMDIYFDDLALNDDSGSFQNSLPGSGKVVYLRPAGQGDNNAWSVGTGGTAGQANNFTRVNEITPDSATSTNTSTDATASQIDDFTVDSPSGAGIGSSDTVNVVAVGAQVAAVTGAASNMTYFARIKGQSAGTVVESAAAEARTVNYGIPASPGSSSAAKAYLLTTYVNPQTSTAWTQSSLSTAQIGYRAGGTSSNGRVVSALWALVDYDPAAFTTHNASGTSAGVGSSAGATTPSGSNLFTSQTPSSANVFESQPVTASNTLTFSATGTVNGGRFYAPTTVGSGTYELVLYRIDTDDSPAASGTGTVLATGLFGPLTAGAWNVASFASPVAVTTTNAYRLGVRTSEGRYAATSAFFASAGLTNGSITAPQDQTDRVGLGPLANGAYIESISAYPNKTFNSNVYFVDVYYTASAQNASGTSAGLGSSTGTASVTRSATGTSTGVESSTGALGRTAVLTGTSAGVGSSTASTSGANDVAGTSPGTGSSASTLALSTFVAGASAGVGTSSATEALTLGVSASSASVGSSIGTDFISRSVTGASAGTGSSSGAILGGVDLAGTSVGVGSNTGALARTTSLAGISAHIASNAGQLQLILGAAASAAGSGSSAGALAATQVLVGVGASTGSSSGSLQVGVGDRFVHRPSTGTVTKPNSGIVTRPAHIVI